MPDYQRMYFQLAAKVAEVIDILIKAQQRGEKDYIEGEAPVFLLTNTKTNQKDINKK